MKMKKVFKSSASYPVGERVKPIIFTAVAIVLLNGCRSNNLSPHRVVKPEVSTHINVDKKNMGDVEPVEPAIAGMMPIAETPKK